MGNAGYSKTTI